MHIHEHTHTYTQVRVSAKLFMTMRSLVKLSPVDSSIKPMQSLRFIEAFKTKLTKADPATTMIFHREIIFKPKQQVGGKFTSGDLNAIILFWLKLTFYL